MLVLGDREIEARTASPRTRAGEQQPAEAVGGAGGSPGRGGRRARGRVSGPRPRVEARRAIDRLRNPVL